MENDRCLVHWLTFLNIFREHCYSRNPERLSPEIVSEEHICAKSIHMELKLQKANEIIQRLQKRCADKNSELDRLRSSLKRLTLSKANLKELLQDIRNKNMISDEGHQVLQVNIFSL